MMLLQYGIKSGAWKTVTFPFNKAAQVVFNLDLVSLLYWINEKS